MTDFAGFISRYVANNSLSDEQLNDPEILSQARDAYVSELTEQSNNKSLSQLQATAEFSKFKDNVSLADFSRTPETAPTNNENVSRIFDFILDIENDEFIPDDGGLASKFGVRQDAYSDFIGKPVDAKTIEELDTAKAEEFYNFLYKKNRLSEINSEQVRSVVFDGIVNHGATGMSDILQNTLNSQFDQSVDTDGVLGSQTINALNNATDQSNSFAVMSSLLEARRDFYKGLDDFEENGEGWIARIDGLYDLANSSLAADGTQATPTNPVSIPVDPNDPIVDEILDDVVDLETTVRDEESFAESAARSVGGGLLKGFSDVPRFIGHLFNSDNLGDFADGIDSLIDAPEEEFANSTTGQVFSGLGQVGGLIIGGLATAPAKIASKLVTKFGSKEAAQKSIVQKLDAGLFPGASGFSMGGVEQVNDYYIEAAERGEEVDEATQQAALFLGGSIGILESVLPGRILNTGYIGKFTDNFTNLFSGSRLKSAAGSAIIEGSTESTQSALHTAVGTALYDADPEIGQALNDAIQEGKVGGIVGAIIGAIIPKGIPKAGGARIDTVVEKTPLEDRDASQNSGEDSVVTGVQISDGSDTNVGSRPAPDNPDSEGGNIENAIEVVEFIEGELRDKDASIENIPSSAQVFDIGQAYEVGESAGNTEQYKSSVFQSYESAVPELLAENDIKNYDELLDAAVVSAKKEIDSIIEQTGLSFKRGNTYTHPSQIKADISKKNTVIVDQKDVGGILDDIAITDGDITYGQIASALQNIGRLSANVDFGFTSDLKSFQAIDTAFNDLSRIALSTHLQGRTARRYTHQDNLKAFEAIASIEREEASSGKSFEKEKRKVYDKLSSIAAPNFILSAPYTIASDYRSGSSDVSNDQVSDAAKRAREDFVSAAQPQSDFSLDEHITEQGGLLAEDRAFADIVIPNNEEISARPGGFVKAVNDILTYGLFNKRDRSLDKEVRDTLGYRGGTQFSAQGMRTSYLRIRDEFNANNPDQNLDDLADAILEGELVLSKKQSDRLPTPENVIQDSNGDYLGEILGTQVVVPKEAIEVIGNFAVVTDRYRQDLLQNLDEINAKYEERIQDANLNVESAALKLINQINSLGIQNTDYLAFTQDGWINNLENGTGAEFYTLNTALNQLFQRISAQRIEQGLDAETYSPEALSKSFFDSARSSANIADFMSSTGGTFGTLQEAHPEVLLALGGYTNSVDIQSLFSNIVAENQMVNKLNDMIDFFNKIKSNPLHISRSYRAYENDRWLAGMRNPKTKEEIDRKQRYTDEVAKNIAKDRGLVHNDGTPRITGAVIAEARITVDNTVDAIGNQSTYTQSNGHVVDGVEFVGSALLKRGDLSDAHREFLGEFTDPATKMQATVNRVSRAAYTTMLNNKIHSQFIGKGLYTTEQAQALPEEVRRKLQPVSLPQEFNLFRNDTFMAEPALKNTIESMTDPEWIGGAPLRLINLVSADFRRFNTVYSLQSASANIIAGWNSLIMTGAFASDNKFAVAKKSYVGLLSALRNGDIGEIRDMVERVGGSEANVQDILSATSHGRSIPGNLIEKLNTVSPEPVSKAMSFVGVRFDKATKMMMDIYALGDLGPKLFAYQFNKDLMMDKLGVSEEVAADLSTEIVRKTMFDYHEVPTIVKQIRDSALFGGGFLSWEALTFSTAYNSGKIGIKIYKLEALKWGQDNIGNFDPNNPVHIQQARRGFKNSGDFLTSASMIKLTGFASGLVMPTVLHTAAVAAGLGLGMAFEDDDTDKDMNSFELSQLKTAMNALMPDYYRNTTKFVTDINDRGNIEWINFSRITNYGNLNEATNALLDENEPDELVRLGNAMESLFGSYFAEGFGLQFVNQLRNNTDKFGNPIFKDEDNNIESAVSMLDFLWRNIYLNGSFKTIGDQTGAWLLDEKFDKNTGEPIEPLDTFMRLSGLRVIEFDPKKSLASKAFSFSNRNRSASKTLNSELKSFNRLSDSQILRAVTRKKEVHDSLMEDAISTIAAARELGLTDKDIQIAFKGKINKKDVNKLLRGVQPVFSLKKLGEGAIGRIEERGLTPEAKRTFGENYNRAKSLLNTL